MQNYFTQSSFSQKISRFSASLFLAAMLGVLAGCSGGADAPPAAPAPTPEDILLLREIRDNLKK